MATDKARRSLQGKATPVKCQSLGTHDGSDRKGRSSGLFLGWDRSERFSCCLTLTCELDMQQMLQNKPAARSLK